ncbi:MAG: hypothetical protein A3F94_01765 [Candidatus Spechtbacteria bacterium RIFCSPLOWO2_12_FULL_38_22]|uniref:SWIM-type domain-containing protein n=1 Tax=Candidatus Spechtbacteria bacterium RIFCSPLOWO2_12_FULL_38_22 TaxID=1802165 RepID=A0A1G2HJL3_9BACT|nr:MAG: hypothetical protein A2728_00300 [Candidatus Spechtbacteria bacterium RIFCSPHIGHO2_01_FULL_38_11]OGZ59277.1 MAG: hypothetical protein A3A00_01610 [Candidatus Spechtbacteria bacterium RIFCSPLOWO2_01_FULL_38_20]OGZ60285.1 MAG: hypothetical protein A3E58_01240 [Candidatus Spechtbacteria bacterium RIFCSPHIGHO2_12_FULL_38_30]OGZ62490.1 MAG: hypothetical protein A3F94_01765 [Candidatus Spechtbacteria bacterium RIFCSPLOWO2_12_FULL_38_22]
MKKNILITGEPKSGKSTLLRKITEDIPNKIGFVTNEISENNGRVGFEIETHSQQKKVLAHINFKTPHKVSRYFVDIQNLESVVSEVSKFKNDDFLYLDEIGQMQLFSDQFKELVLKYLNSQNTCLATLSCVFEDDFTKSIKEREDIIIVEISSENRNEKEKFLRQLIKKVGKAKGYISEPQRFNRKGSQVELRSEHDIRILSLTGSDWSCVCDFYKEYGICSHAIAVQEVFK